MVVATLLNSVLRLHTLYCKAKHCVSDLPILDLGVEFLITIFGLDVADFVVPPHDGFPIGLIIFKENSVVVRILSQSDNDIFSR